MKKKKKKLKQIAGQKHAETLQRTARKNTVGSKQASMNAQTQDIYQRGGNNAVAQNKENKEFSLQRPLHQRGACFQNQSGEFHHFSGGPSGGTWHQPYVRDRFTQSSHHLRYDDNLSVNNQRINIKVESSQTDRLIKKPHNTQQDPTNTPEHITWPAMSQYDYYNTQYSSAADKDFTSDHLPQNGAIIFDHSQNESAGSSQPGQEVAHCSANPASANSSVNAAPIRDVDVSAMLKQIRRALGVREPCRADREARRQNSVAGGQVVGTKKEPPSGVSSVQSPLVSCPAPAAHSAVSASSIAPAKPKQTTFRMTEEIPQHYQRRSVIADGLSNSRETQGVLDGPISGSQRMGKTTSSEPNLNVSHRVRIAHQPGRAQEGKETRLEPTLNKLFSLSGARSKLSWSEMCEGMKRKKQDSVKGMPR